MAFVIQLLAATVLLAAVSCEHDGAAYHYNSFQGPVSGAIRRVQVPVSAASHQHQQQNPHHQQSAPHDPNSQDAVTDYVAKPDYAFAYGVEDPNTGNMQQHKESRDGDAVRGQYNVLQPDGSMRTVTYTADSKNGFQATVHNTAPTIKQQQFATPVDGHGKPLNPNYGQALPNNGQYNRQNDDGQYRPQYDNAQYNHSGQKVNKPQNNGQYNNGQHNNGQNNNGQNDNGQKNNGQYNNGQYNEY